MEQLTESFRYKVFLSYRQKDGDSLAERVARAIENYRVPRNLVGTAGQYGPLPKRVGKVFRDRDEARSERNIETALTASLSLSEQLVVLCTPSVREPGSWVPREIQLFQQVRPAAPIHALIGLGEPSQCLPDEVPAIDSEGRIQQPLSPDLRRGKDGFQRGVIRLIAGIIGADFDTLWRRERRRLVVRAMAWSMALAAAAMAALLLTLSWREQASMRMINRANSLIPQHTIDDHSEALGVKLALEAHRAAPSHASVRSILQAALWRGSMTALYETDINRPLVAQNAVGRQAMAISAEGSIAVAATRKGQLPVFRLEKDPRPMTVGTGLPPDATVSAVALSVSGRCITMGDTRGGAGIISSPDTHCRMAEASEIRVPAPAVAVFVDEGAGAWAVGGSQRKVALRIHGASSTETLPPSPKFVDTRYSSMPDFVTAVSILPWRGGKALVAGTSVGDIWLRHLTLFGVPFGHWRLLRSPTGYPTYFVVAGGDGNSIVASGDNDDIHVWTDGSEKGERIRKPQPSSIGTLVASSPRTIYTGDWRGGVFDVRLSAAGDPADLFGRISQHKSAVIAASLSGDARTLATWSTDGSVRITGLDKAAVWKGEGLEVGTVDRHSVAIRNNRLLAQDAASTRHEWHLDTGQHAVSSDSLPIPPTKTNCDHLGIQKRVRLVRDGIVVEGKSIDGVRWTEVAYRRGMRLAAISRDCQSVAMASFETVSLLDLATLRDIVSPVGRAKYRIDDLLYDRNGEWLAVAVDERVWLLDAREGRLLGYLVRHRGNRIEALVENPDGLELYAFAAGRVFVFPTPAGAIRSLCSMQLKLREDEAREMASDPAWLTTLFRTLGDWFGRVNLPDGLRTTCSEPTPGR